MVSTGWLTAQQPQLIANGVVDASDDDARQSTPGMPNSSWPHSTRVDRIGSLLVPLILDAKDASHGRKGAVTRGHTNWPLSGRHRRAQASLNELNGGCAAALGGSSSQAPDPADSPPSPRPIGAALGLLTAQPARYLGSARLVVTLEAASEPGDKPLAGNWAAPIGFGGQSAHSDTSLVL